MTIIVFILLCFIWGSTWIAIKLGLNDAPPLYASSFRFVISIIILYAIIFVKKYSLPKTLKRFFYLGYPGIYMYGGSYALIYLAEQYINSSLTAVLFASFPLFVALLSLGILKEEKQKIMAWLGLILGFVGIIVISYDSLQTSEHIFWGTILALGGSFLAALGVVIHKKHFARDNIYVSIAVQMTLGGIPLLFSAIIFEHISSFLITWQSVGSILYLSVLGTVVAFVGYYWLLARIDAVAVSLIAFITPLVAIFIGVVLFGESLSWLIFLGTLMILSGVFLVMRKSPSY